MTETETKLDVFARLMLMQILPKEGSITTLRMIRDLIAKVGISADEMTEYEVKQDDTGKATWNAKGLEEKPFKFKDAEVAHIKIALKKLDKEEKLGQQHVSLWDKFVGE